MASRILFAFLILLALAHQAVAASPCTLPYVFTNGTVADATQVNSDLSSLQNCANGIYNRINPTQTAGGSANALTLSYTPAVTAYTAGDAYTFIVGTTNTGAATLNINGLGAKSVLANGNGLIGGEMQVGRGVLVYYDGTNFQLLLGNALTGTPLFGSSGAAHDWHSATNYIGTGCIGATGFSCTFIIPYAGNLTSLSVAQTNTGGTITATVYVNNTVAALTCQMITSQTSCVDAATGHMVAVAAGALVTLQIVGDASAPNDIINFSIGLSH